MDKNNKRMTQEQFLQILPAYMGRQALLPNGTQGTIVCIELSGDIVVASDKAYELHASDIKLILRTFDQMTDEESARFRQLADEADKHSYALWAMNATKAVNYLRSIGIDCDGLIEAGYAIKEGTERNKIAYRNMQ